MSPEVPPARVLLDRHALDALVARIGHEIEAEFPDGVVLVGVLKGALLFLADLARAIRTVPVLVDFLAITRYAPDSGRVRIVHDVGLELAGRDVVLVEDLVDTGLTLAYLVRYVEGLGARRVEVCTLLDRPARRIVPVQPRFVGATIADVFVLGGGLHHADRYRNLAVVLEADPRALAVDPDAYRSWYSHPEVREEAGGTLDAEAEASR